MNANLLNIVNRIVAEQGEGILTDAKRLFPYFSDYAKNEHKEERAAFGRCIEYGAYQVLKNTRTADERRRVKAALADQINSKTGVDRPRCADALDLLEAVIFKGEQQIYTSPSKAKLCSKCGKIINDGEIFCSKCGTPIAVLEQTYVSSPVPQYTSPPRSSIVVTPDQMKTNDKSSFGYAFLSFLFPVAGLVLFLVWKENYPLRSKSCGKGALISVVIGFVIGFVIGIRGG
jgi:hypothetical protein